MRERQTLVSRRNIMPLTAAALMGVTALPAVAVEPPSDLARLIDAHRAAHAAFNESCTRDDEADRNAPGYAAIERAWREANEADEAAFIAICAYVCRSADDGRTKAAYLLQVHELMNGFQPDHVEALLHSIAGGVANV
jgi:hypothetical protein